MNPNDRTELARLVPAPVERELPSDRHHQLQEFVMSEIHRDPRTAGPAARRPLLRRSVLVTSALTAVAATAAAIGVGVAGDTGDRPVPPRPPTALSGQEILLAAATTAQRQPEGTGNYWYVKVVSRDAEKKAGSQWETWSDRDGGNWFRAEKTGNKVITWPRRGFTLGAPNVTFAQLQELPTTPDALKAWITEATDNADVRNSGGELDAKHKEQHVFYGLISLVSQLPAPPKVRATALQAIATYPNVTSLGPVDGGQGLRITLAWGDQVRLVIDPVAAQIRETEFFVTPEGALYGAGEGGSISLTAEWTGSLPA